MNARSFVGWLSILTAAIMLSACAARFQPPGPPIASPTLAEEYWLTADGQRLGLRRWLPPGAPRAVVIALHGMNDYSNAFEGPGRFLSGRGIAVYAYDQRGFGRSPDSGLWSDTPTMAADLGQLASLLAERHPGLPLILLGESMGGAVTMVAATGQLPPAVKGLVLSAPAVWGRSDMPWVQRLALWLAYQVAPGWRPSGEGLKIQASDNLEMLHGLWLDPLVIKGTRIDAVKGLVDLMDSAEASPALIRLPTLVLYGEKDQVIPPEPTWRMVGRLPGPRQRAAYYATGWHMLLRDLKAEIVLEDIAAWITDPDAPLPSGADRRAAAELERRGNP